MKDVARWWWGTRRKEGKATRSFIGRSQSNVKTEKPKLKQGERHYGKLDNYYNRT